MSMTFNTQIIAASGEEVSAGQTLKFNTINAPTSSDGTTYGPGTSGQVLKSNGTTVYWGTDNNTTYSAGTGISLSGTAFSIDSTVATLSGTQTLTNKTVDGGTY